MLTLARASDLLHRMPNKLLVKEITKRECEQLWEFTNSQDKLSISQQRLKTSMADECGVMLERLLEVLDDSPFVEAMVMEAGDEPSEYTLKEAVQLMRSAHLNENWILPFCHSISKEEALVIWRWAINYYWAAYRNRFLKWLSLMSKLNGDYSVDVHMSVIYDGLQISDDIKPFKRLEPWEGGVPDMWWFVPDCGTLKYVGDGVVRNRNGTLNTELTPLVDSDAECWIWQNPLGTGYQHSTKDSLPFSSYKNPMADQFHWHESQVLLDSYAKGGFLVASRRPSVYKELKKSNLITGERKSRVYKEHKNYDYYLLSKGSNILYGSVMTIRNLNKGGYEIVIGFSDAGEVVETTTHIMNELPFVLNNALKRRGVSANIRYAFHTVEDCLVGKFMYTWSPNEEWHLKFVDVEESKGESDVDDILDYFAVVGGEDESS